MKIAKINISNITSKLLKQNKYLSSFPEYYKLASITENNAWHINQNVFDHVVGVFAGLEEVLKFKDLNNSQVEKIYRYLSTKIGLRTRKEVLIVATLLHDIAKTDTLVKHKDGTTSCPSHELIAAGRVKHFSKRFGLNKDDEIYVERIVRYHGFISEILNLIIENSNKEKYSVIFEETVGDVAIELILLMYSDILGCDLKTADIKGYKDRINCLAWMLQKLLKNG